MQSCTDRIRAVTGQLDKMTLCLGNIKQLIHQKDKRIEELEKEVARLQGQMEVKP
jgi:archaellum component FlaC